MDLRDNVLRLRERVERACARAGRDPASVKIVAATKCVPEEVVRLLPQYGIDTAGENRVQEFLQKYREDSPLAWHIIGALQTNKVKYVVGKVGMIQSVDRLALAEEISRLSHKHGIVTDVLIEVNIGGEEAKSGVAPQDAAKLVAKVSALAAVRVRGLMSVPPIDAPVSMYEKMKTLFDDVKRGYPDMDTLSMGMSNDFETAIRCGADMIRPGRALFGERNR